MVLTPDGFAVGGEGWRWGDVTAVREQLNPGSPLNGLTVWVERAGRSVRLSASQVAGLHHLLAVVHRHTLTRLTAKAREAVDRGEAVRLGPLELDATGLRAKGRVLPWEELGQVTPDAAGDLGVWTSGRVWLDVATGKVDNVRVLLQLVEEYTPNPQPR